jgi:hypothetical protein
MKALVAIRLTLVLALVLFLTVIGAIPAQPPVNPGQAPTTQPGAPSAPQPGADRNTTFDVVIAFFGVALVLVVVCYPSRRY